MTLMGVTIAAHATILRVSPNGNNTNWSSWPNAYTNPQSALAVAVSGDEIWVAAGTYKPSTNDRTVSFVIHEKIKVRGGFLGVPAETQASQRDPIAHVTILSGDLNGDDNSITFQNYGENSYHVVRFEPAPTGHDPVDANAQPAIVG